MYVRKEQGLESWLSDIWGETKNIVGSIDWSKIIGDNLSAYISKQLGLTGQTTAERQEPYYIYGEPAVPPTPTKEKVIISETPKYLLYGGVGLGILLLILILKK